MQVKMMPDDPSEGIKVSVYVTHDWNLAGVLSAMRLSNGVRPPPCSTITFEMYKQGEDLTVRTLFFNATHPELGADQQPHPLVLDGCTEYCPLSDFVDFFKDVIPEDHKELCGETLISVENPDEDVILLPMYNDMKAILLNGDSVCIFDLVS
ncbi:lysosomal acid phosphatase [Caerostris extrusa]|uniref:Lysosomal acid phosphatase n=1 Tax=Caerostris extrusa TaxID=172846 RepID=A0AAV4M4C2_CAEEX|nr:lysosomal acid phosphatase [Caerostris extrusa]